MRRFPPPKLRATTLLLPVVLVLGLVILASCASGPSEAPRVSLAKVEPMHWRLEAPGARIDILGTIHFGIPGSAGLPTRVVEALDGADRIYGELSSADYRGAEAAVTRLITASILPPGKGLGSYLGEKDQKELVAILGQVQFDALARFKPWVMNLVLTQAVYAQVGLDPSQGLDVLVYARAGNREIQGLDSLESQMAILDAGSTEEQVGVLVDSLGRYKSGELEMLCRDLVEAYGRDDEAGIARLIKASEESGSPGPEAAFYEKVFAERNRSWAQAMAGMLKEGGRYFVFAGAGHFVGKASVFDILADMGVLPRKPGQTGH